MPLAEAAFGTAEATFGAIFGSACVIADGPEIPPVAVNPGATWDAAAEVGAAMGAPVPSEPAAPIEPSLAVTPAGAPNAAPALPMAPARPEVPPSVPSVPVIAGLRPPRPTAPRPALAALPMPPTTVCSNVGINQKNASGIPVSGLIVMLPGAILFKASTSAGCTCISMESPPRPNAANPSAIPLCSYIYVTSIPMNVKDSLLATLILTLIESPAERPIPRERT